MAWLEQDPSGKYHVRFRFAGQKFRRSLRTANKRTAEARCTRLEETISLVESGRLPLPDETADLGAYLLADGKVSAARKKPLTLGELFEAYRTSLPEGFHEPETVRIARIHTGHLERILGARSKVEHADTPPSRYVTIRPLYGQ